MSMEPDRDAPLPLALVRDHLRAAQDILVAERKANPSPELDAVLDDLMMLLLKLKAVGKDGHWAE
jgi:hypothetical protein